jgi:hypothetical protein
MIYYSNRSLCNLARWWKIWLIRVVSIFPHSTRRRNHLHTALWSWLSAPSSAIHSNTASSPSSPLINIATTPQLISLHIDTASREPLPITPLCLCLPFLAYGLRHSTPHTIWKLLKQSVLLDLLVDPYAGLLYITCFILYTLPNPVRLRSALTARTHNDGFTG